MFVRVCMYMCIYACIFNPYSWFFSFLVLQAVMAEARSQQAASLTEFHWLGHKFPISNAKTRVAILKGCNFLLLVMIREVNIVLEKYIDVLLLCNLFFLPFCD